MTVLDASALLSALQDEPGRPLVEDLLRGTPPPSISAVNLAEVLFKLERQAGWSADEVRDRIDWLLVGGLQVEPAWPMVARRAAAIRATHFHRETAPLSLADCICLATAFQLGTDLATTDPTLAAVARALGIEVTLLVVSP